MSSLVAKYRKNVAGETSAAAAISCTVVSAYPWSRNSRSACSWMAARVLAFLRSRSPGSFHRHTPIVATSAGSGAPTPVRRGRKATASTSPRAATAQHVHRVAFIPCTKASRADVANVGKLVCAAIAAAPRRRCRGPRRRQRAAGA